jgi:SAM-dependent methyltransferase
MNILCPICQTPIDPETLCCADGHQFQSHNGVLSLLDTSMERQFDAIYHHLETSHRHLPKITDYNALPYELAKKHFEWRLRSYDADIVLQLLINRRQQNILEISPWNGWLSHHLVKSGHKLTAIDYFAHLDNGLGAKRHYDADWQAIQMDLTDLSILEPCFDVVIINHGLHFFPDPATHLIQARDLLLPGGLLIIINATFYRNPVKRIQQVKSLEDDFFEVYGLPIFLKPTRGYMDFTEKAQLQVVGVRFSAYRQLWRANLKAMLIRTAPSYFYGILAVPD